MLGAIIGRLMTGALWGLGALAVIAAAHRDSPAARPTAKRLMKASIVATDNVLRVAAETREAIEDLYAEVRAEQRLAEEAEVAGLSERSEPASLPRVIARRSRDAADRSSKSARSRS